MIQKYHGHRRSAWQRVLRRGFTLVEIIFVTAMLGMTAAAILTIQPQVFKVQNVARDGLIGQEIVRACGEKLLGIRRTTGYSTVTTTSCRGLGGTSGFDPVVTMLSGTGCSGTTCTVTIKVRKNSADVAGVMPVTLRLSSY